MPLFETMRENTKAILWVTVIAFVGLIFLAWGADFTSSLGGARDGEPGVLARINGEPILASDFSETYEQTRVMYEQQTGKPLDEGSELLLRNATWEQLVERALMRHAIKERRIRVSTEEIAAALMQSPPARFMSNPGFQTDGRFDIKLYQAWLADPRTNTVPLENEEREMLEQAKLQLTLLAGVGVSAAEVREAWLGQNQKAELAYAQIAYTRIQVPEEVADTDLERHLAEHREDFIIPEQALMEYVRLPKGISAEDSSEARSEIRDAYEELQRGEPFDVVVQIYSEAPPSRRGGADGTYMQREQFAEPAVRDAAFALPIGGVSEILASEQGLHIIRVEDRKTEGDAEQVKIAEIFVPRRMSYETNFALQEQAADIADSAGVVGLREAAAARELSVSETGFFDPEGFIPGLRGLTAAQEFSRSAQPGEISRPIETEDAWYVLQIKDRRPERQPVLDEVRTRLRSAFRLEQRKQIAREVAERIVGRCRDGLTLEAATRAESLAVFGTAAGVSRIGFARGLGQEPKVTGAAFAREELGLLPFPILANQGAYIIEVLGREPLDEQAFESERETLRQRMLREKQNRVIGDWLREQKEQARIDDYRTVLLSVSA